MTFLRRLLRPNSSPTVESRLRDLEAQRLPTPHQHSWGLRAARPNPAYSTLGTFAVYGGQGLSTHTDYGVTMAYLYVDKMKQAVDAIVENALQARYVVSDKTGKEIASDDRGGSSAFLDVLDEQLIVQGIHLFEWWLRDFLLYGRAYFEVTRNGGRITYLRRLNPLAITRQISNGRIVSYSYGGQGLEDSRYIFKPSQILYTHLFHPGDDLDGYSPAMSAMTTAEITYQFKRYFLAWVKNQGQPGMIVTPKADGVGIAGQYDLQDAEELARLWQREFQSTENFFRTYVSHIPLDVTQLELANISGPLDVIVKNEDAILEAFRVPRRMLGGGSNGGVYESAEEVKKGFIQTVVNNWLLRITALINSYLMPNIEPGHKFRFDLSQFETTSQEVLRQEQVYTSRLNNGGLTLNRYRELIGEETVTGGDLIKLQNGVVMDVKLLAEMDGTLMIGMPGQITDDTASTDTAQTDEDRETINDAPENEAESEVTDEALSDAQSEALRTLLSLPTRLEVQM